MQLYGTLADGRCVHRLDLQAPGIRVELLTYGGIVARLEVPDRAGRADNVVLGMASLADYVARSPYFGAIAGRFANRIAGGRFTLDGQAHQLACNDGPNSLHGGLQGFDKQVWRVLAADPARAVLTYASPAGEEGFPGRLAVTMTYSVAPGALRIDYAAETDAPTVLNLTNHSYFNLAGDSGGSVLDHELSIAADHFLPVDATAIPTGEIRSVDATPFDFRSPTPIGARIRATDPQIRAGRGYDHTWVLSGAPGPAARLRDPASGRVLELFTDQPGVQIYTANFLDGSLAGPSGHPYRQGDAVTLETQHFPDSPNQPGFPSTVLRPGETFRSHSLFRFSA